MRNSIFSNILSLVGWLFLQFCIATIFFISINGADLIAGALPNWALAIAAAGGVMLMIAAVAYKNQKLIIVPIGMIAVIALQIGSGSALVGKSAGSVRDAHALPTLADLVTMFSWFIVIGLAFAGLVSVIALANRKPTVTR